MLRVKDWLRFGGSKHMEDTERKAIEVDTKHGVENETLCYSL